MGVVLEGGERGVVLEGGSGSGSSGSGGGKREWFWRGEEGVVLEGGRGSGSGGGKREWFWRGEEGVVLEGGRGSGSGGEQLSYCVGYFHRNIDHKKVDCQDYAGCLKELMDICLLCNDSALVYNEVLDKL